jgi:hypothetical protein
VGDGFEIETVLDCRVAAAGLIVREVASVERPRIYGASNLHAVRDGLRVLKTIVTERWVCRSLGRRRAPAAPRRIVAVYTSSVDPMDRSGRRPGRDGPAQDARRAGGRERDPSGRCPDAAGASVLTNVDGIMRRRSASPWWDL